MGGREDWFTDEVFDQLSEHLEEEIQQDEIAMRIAEGLAEEGDNDQSAYTPDSTPEISS